MGRCALALWMLAGCDSAFGLHAAQLADGATAPRCTQITPTPLFCADFDDKTTTLYVQGIAAAAPNPPSGVTTTLEAETISPGYALRIATTGPSYTFGAPQTSALSVATVEASFSLNIESFSASSPTVIADVGLNTPSYNHCFAELGIGAGSALIAQSHCGSSNPDIYETITVLPALPQGWVHVAMSYNITAGTTSFQIDNTTPVVLNMQFAGHPAGAPHATFGMQSSMAVTATIGIDDIVVTAP